MVWKNESVGQNDYGSVPHSSQSGEGLRWRAWPCAACSGGVSPVGHLVRCLASSSAVQPASPEAIAQTQAGQLLEWVGHCAHHAQGEILLPKVAEGSEHIVFLDATNAKVFKATKRGLYGESYYLVDNIVNQRNCSPLEYLLRLRFWKKIFLSAPKDLGITEAGQIISTHEFISGNPPTQEAVDFFLAESGLTAVRQNCWLWKKSYPEFDIWVGDARLDNFVQTPAGIVPIDIRVWT